MGAAISSAFNVAEYHFHFLASNRARGGRCLIVGSNLCVSVDRLNEFHLSLPESEEFLRANLSEHPSKELA